MAAGWLSWMRHAAAAQKGHSKPGHRPLQERHDYQILALTDALGNLMCFIRRPGHRFDTVGIASLIDGLAFGGLITDTALTATPSI